MNDQNKNIPSAPEQKPWLNPNGKVRGKKEIREISRQWSVETWEEYLRATEKQHEVHVLDDPADVDNFSKDYFKMMFSMSEDKTFPRLQRAVLQALKELTPREQDVLHMTFWDRMSTRKIAEKLNISRIATRTYLKRGKQKIREIIEKKILQKNQTLTKNLVALL